MKCEGLHNILNILPSFHLPEEVAHAIQVEAEGEAHGLVQRIGLGRGEDVGGIDSEDAHVEASSDGEILTVTLVLRLVVIARTEHEAVVVGVFCTKAPLYLLHFLLESTRGIAKALEDTGNG